MIYTVTLNPAIDYAMDVMSFQLGKTNRSSTEHFDVGGKGINVSIVLNNLGIDTTALGFLGGFSGDFIKTELQKYKHIQEKFTQTDNPTRINVKLKGEQETEINGGGMPVTRVEQDEITAMIETLMEAKLVVFSGSKANGMHPHWYYQVAERLKTKKVPFVFDVATQDLLELVTLNPLLVKPNQAELEELYDKRCKNEEEVISLAQQLYEAGAQHVIVTRGEHGAVMVCKSGVYTVKNPAGTLINSVGAGDSVVAGFIYGYTKNKQPQEALQYGIACGCGTAYSTQLVEKDLIYKLLNQIIIEKK